MYRIFSIAIPSDGEEEAELNRFLASHRIVSVRAQWVTSGDVPYEVFTVEYSGVSKVGGNREQSTAFDGKEIPSRPDYRKLLTPEQFIRYCKMRDERKKIADAEVVKAFVVFTNEQLAEIAKLENPTLEGLKKIDGIGEARVEKYGQRIIDCIRVLSKDSEEVESDRSQSIAIAETEVVVK